MDFGMIGNIIVGTLPVGGLVIGVVMFTIRQVNHRIDDTNNRIDDINNRINDTNNCIANTNNQTNMRITELKNDLIDRLDRIGTVNNLHK